MDIIDLHCDLLWYLSLCPHRSPENRETRCSLPQLLEGKVRLQTLAIYTNTHKDPVSSMARQCALFHMLTEKYSKSCAPLQRIEKPVSNGKVHFLAAIENASGLCEEEEKLENAFTRLEHYIESVGPFLYISLTWNQENRFAGGNHSPRVGLKREGEILLDYLSCKGIAIDMSHTSDLTAYEILNYIDKKGLKITPIASHSNFRSITNVARNLPDALAKEICNRGGVIGLNFIRSFIGMPFEEMFREHIEQALTLHIEEHLCFGADFFYDLEPLPSSNSEAPFFYAPFDHSACYPHLLEQLKPYFSLELLAKIAHGTLDRFLANGGRI